MEYAIRWAKQDEWYRAMDMVWRTFLRFDAPDCTPEGRRNFRGFIMDDRLYQAFLKGSYQLLTALDGDRIIGVGSLRNINHLSLLFVEEAYHLKGVGRAMLEYLCDYLKNEVGERYISVTASPYGLEFYIKMGFMQIKPQEMSYGMPVVSMEKVF